MKTAAAEKQAVFGGADGIVLAVGFVAGLTGDPHVLVRAATSAGLAEPVGMTAGSWLSDSRDGFWPALANGAAALVACVLPALPYAVTSGSAALAASLVLVVAIAAVIAHLRPEKGALAYVQTAGVLGVAAGLCYAAGLI